MSKVLIIDDDPDIRMIIGLTLIDNGFEIVEASDGHEAVLILSEGPDLIDVILLDLRMPGMDGNAVLGWLRSQPQLKQPVLLLTGYIGELKQENVDRVSKILDKPGSMKGLVEAVKSAVALKELE